MTASSGGWCKFRGANPHLKGRARFIVSREIRKGTLKRLLCEICGASAEGHHEDYAEPTNLIWLCRFHHSQRHQGVTVEEMKTWPAYQKLEAQQS